MTDARIAKSWWFKSSSNESKVYETILYTDGTTSCNCFGWTRRCKDGVRSCKHTRMVESGIADSYCETSSGQLAPPAKKKAVKYDKMENLGRRKISWENQ